MDLFNSANVIYWLLFSILILVETLTTAENWDKPAWKFGRRWPESQRWGIGFISLYGTSLIMIFAGWDFRTICWLAAASALSRALSSEKIFVGNIWSHRSKEAHRWTIQYFLSFLVAIPAIVFGKLDLQTWITIFFALGIAGAIKVWRESYISSQKAKQIRNKKIPIIVTEETGGPTDRQG